MKSNQKIQNINLVDLPKSEFKISIEEDIIRSILDDIKIKGKTLYEKLSNLESQKEKKIHSIERNFLDSWKKGNRIPLDCFELLCTLSNRSILDYQKDICGLFSKNSKNSWKINFPLELNENLFLISEAIRTEGCIIKSKFKNYTQGIAISNKDLYLLETIEKTLNKLNINSGFSRILNVIIYLDKKRVIHVVNKEDNKKLHFHFNNGRLIFLEQVKDYNIEKNYVIYFENKTENLKVKISDKNILFTQSNLWGTSYLTLQVYNSVFAKFLSYYFEIPYGIGNKKTYTIDFPFNIDLLSDNILKTILNIVISCEGSIFCGKNKGDRHLQIKIASRKYLEKLQLMFKRFNIDSKINKASEEKLHVLHIRKKSNFDKLFSLLSLIVKYKQDKLREIVVSYLKNRMPHYEATLNYLIMLKKLEPTNLKNISKTMNRNYNTLIGVFNRLEKQDYVVKYGRKFLGIGTTPWIYRISEKGLEYINRVHTRK